MGKRPSLEVGVTHYHIPPNHRQTEIGVHLTNEKQSLAALRVIRVADRPGGQTVLVRQQPALLG